MSQRKWKGRKGPENLGGDGQLCYGFPAISMKQARYQEKLGNVLLKWVLWASCYEREMFQSFVRYYVISLPLPLLLIHDFTVIPFLLFSDISWRPAEEQRLKGREHDFRHTCKLAVSFLLVLLCLKQKQPSPDNRAYNSYTMDLLLTLHFWGVCTTHDSSGSAWV